MIIAEVQSLEILDSIAANPTGFLIPKSRVYGTIPAPFLLLSVIILIILLSRIPCPSNREEYDC